jgi:hypothetical protein
LLLANQTYLYITSSVRPSHQIELTFDDMNVDLNKGRGRFYILNFPGAPPFYTMYSNILSLQCYIRLA